MASPSGGSLSTLITRGTRSGMSSSIRSPVRRPEIETRPCWGRFRPSSTKSWPTTRMLPPSSGIPQRKSFAASVTSTDTTAVTARCGAILRKHHRPHRETFIPLGHLPGQRLEADFGHIYVDFPDGRRQVPFLVAAWAYSNAPFVIALPCERTEAILHGMVAAFEFFGAVAKEVWWDNPKTVATLVLKGRERQLHPRYAALASHYVFDPRCCMPARGNEKPDAEGTVKAVQRRFATPVPRVADLDELNRFFRKCCEAERERTVQSLLGPFLIKTRLAEDLAAAPPLPKHPFDPCVIDPAVGVDKYQTVAFDCNRYSVPRPFAHRMVTVKGYVDRVVLVAEGRVVATHARSYQKQTLVLDPVHYLATLGRKPGVLDHAPVFRDWRCRHASPTSAPRSKNSTARWPAHDGTCGYCNSWASIP